MNYESSQFRILIYHCNILVLQTKFRVLFQNRLGLVFHSYVCDCVCVNENVIGLFYSFHFLAIWRLPISYK
jgi:hypothetical protein